MATNGKPSIEQRAREAICPECGGAVVRKTKTGPIPTFCSKEHKLAFNRRATNEGAAVIAFLKAWRVDRGSGPIAQESLAQLCQIVDRFNSDDLRLGRTRADFYAAKLISTGRLYIDRRQPK